MMTNDLDGLLSQYINFHPSSPPPLNQTDLEEKLENSRAKLQITLASLATSLWAALFVVFLYWYIRPVILLHMPLLNIVPVPVQISIGFISIFTILSGLSLLVIALIRLCSQNHPIGENLKGRG